MISARVFDPAETLHAPELLDVEVLQVLRRFHLSRELTAERGAEAVRDLRALPIERYSHELLLDRIWELRSNVTAYDAAYVALAQLLRCPLMTADLRLARAATQLGVAAEVAD